jgi:iron(II)-dependent oxidoreductase
MLTERESTAGDLARDVEQAHQRTLARVADLQDSQLNVPLVEHVNPLLWELGHVAFFYDLFVLHELDGGPLVEPRGKELYDSFDVCHEDRWELELPSRGDLLAYVHDVRRRVVARLEGHTPSEHERYLYRLAVQHEDMHGEAFTYMRHCLGLPAPPVVVEGRERERPGAGTLPGDSEIPGGTFLLGARKGASFAYDNEKWAHDVEVEPFRIARAPVTNAEFQVFVEDGGYSRRELWSYCGWVWRRKAGAEHPVTWRRVEGSWQRACYDLHFPLEPHQPVAHVNWYEAEAFCAWAGRRLPSEAEWELAASGALWEQREPKRRFAWGDGEPEPGLANLACWYGGSVDVADFPESDSAFGCRQMNGNVWEWTNSDFYPFPGYIVDQPYREYSAPWFGHRKVLRGGSWATQPSLAYNTYRNFFPPRRNDIFAGFRTCAK